MLRKFEIILLFSLGLAASIVAPEPTQDNTNILKDTESVIQFYEFGGYDFKIKFVKDKNEKQNNIEKFKKETALTNKKNQALILKFIDEWFVYGYDNKGSFKELKLNSNDELAKELEERTPTLYQNKFIEKIKLKFGHIHNSWYVFKMIFVKNEKEKQDTIEKFKKQINRTNRENQTLILKFKNEWFIYGDLRYYLNVKVAEDKTEIQREIDIFKEQFSLSGNVHRALIIKLKEFYYRKMYIPESQKKIIIDDFKKASIHNTNQALILNLEDNWVICGYDDKDSFKEIQLDSNDELKKELEEEPKDRKKFIEKLKIKLGRIQLKNDWIVYYYDKNGSFKELELDSNDELAKELEEKEDSKDWNEFIKKLALKLGHTYDVKNSFKEIKLSSNDELAKELEGREPRYGKKFIKKIRLKLGHTQYSTVPVTTNMLPENPSNIIFMITYNDLVQHIQYPTIKELKQDTWNQKTLENKMEFNRTFCSNPEELALLDFFLWFGNKPNDQRMLYKRCNSDRSKDEIQESISSLRKTIAHRLKPINVPLNFSSKSLATILKDDPLITPEFMKEMADDSEFFLVKLGNFSLYQTIFSKEDFAFYHSPFPWDEFSSPKDWHSDLMAHSRILSSHKVTLLLNQTRLLHINTTSLKQSNKAILKQIKANYKVIKSKPIHTKDQALLTKSIGCLEKLSDTKPEVNLGYYSGFFARYATEYSPIDKQKNQNPQYKKTSDKLKSVYNNYLFKGNLFSHRLSAIATSCQNAL